MRGPNAVTAVLLKTSYNTWIVLLSILIASFASYVALDLARRVWTRDRFSAGVWTAGGALVLGTGIWSMHFVGMLGFSLPIPIGFAAGTTFLSWIAAVVVSAIALRVASRDRLNWTSFGGGALAMGAGICAMHYIGMAAMDMAPGIVWNYTLVAASALIAVGASAAALLIFFGLRRLKGLMARLGQIAAALVMGIAISGMHYTGMAAAGFPEGSVCLSADALGGQSLGTMVVLATVVLLSITLFTSALDARMQAKTHRLAQSLQQANQQLQGANEELQRIAFRDPLTGVPNRALLEDRLTHAIARVDRQLAEPGTRGLARLGLLFIDLDGFKPVNDVDGHAAGDALLKQVAARLAAIARDTDTLARIGGDEFVVLLEDLNTVADAVAMAGRVLAAIGQPFELPERKVTLSASIGVAVYPDHGLRDKLMASADAAMYAAKRAGGGSYAVFEDHMHEGAAEQLDLQQALREAVARGELRLHYQPKIDAISGRVRGVEALARWIHPERGVISPGVFIPIAERFGLIVPIGNWVIDEACRQLAAWADEGRRLRVSVNLSGYQLRQPDVVQRVQQAILQHRVDPAQLICEITESVAMEDTAATQRVIEQLAVLGVKLSIDDFGTGYSSLASLRQLQTHEVKIDRSFVQDVATDKDARAVVDAIVRLARALGLRVVAEGVETPQQRDTLVALGCDELQGFYFARPMEAEALVGTDLWTSDGNESVEFSPSAFIG